MIKLANIKQPVKQTEESELLQVVKWFELQYPNEIFKSNYDHFKSSIYHAKRQKDLHTQLKGYPDIFIPKMKQNETGSVYGGLFIEFKRSGTKILTKQQKYASPHLLEQSKFLTKLCNLGYYAVFGVGFEDTIKIINNYMNLGDYEFKKI
jgi:hypothetical protein